MKSNNMQKVLAAILPLSLILFSCQMEAPVLPQEMEPQLGQQQELVSGTQANSNSLKGDGVTGNAAAPKNDIILGVTQVRVQFDPAYGKFYPASGKPTQNPINHDLTTGYHITPPHITPYKEGTNFKGWVRDYPYPGLTFTEEDFWNFEQDILTESMNLYAYFVDSETPDPEPKIQASAPSVPSYGGGSQLFDYPVEDVPHVTSLGQAPDAAGLYRFFAAGVTKESGWLNNVQYKNHCWATSTSQMLYWYQNRINDLAKTKPQVGFTASETPVKTDTKVKELRDWFGSRHELSGWHIAWALDEYFSANYPGRKGDIVSYHCVNGVYFTRESLSKILLKHLSRGDMCGLTAVNFDGGLHAMNIYGADFDANGIVQTIYVTSSPTLDSEERIASHKPKLYEFKYNGTSSKGAPEWIATYDVSRDGYTSTSQTSIRNIYRLDFLSMERYK